MLLCLSASEAVTAEPVPATDARAALRHAAETIRKRANIRFAYLATKTGIPAEDDPIAFQVSGDYLASDGRTISHHRPIWTDRTTREVTTNDRTRIFDGTRADHLTRITTPDTDVLRGYTYAENQGEVYWTGVWLLNARVEPLAHDHPVLRERSLVDLLAELPDDALNFAAATGPGEKAVLRVGGTFYWGSCRLWLDPARGYNVVRLDLSWRAQPDWGNPAAPPPDEWRWSTRRISFARVGGQWIPDGTVLRSTYVTHEAGVEVRYESEILIALRDITLLEAPVPDPRFVMHWPEGTDRRDRRPE